MVNISLISEVYRKRNFPVALAIETDTCLAPKACRRMSVKRGPRLKSGQRHY